jgi:hypothetical protein
MELGAMAGILPLLVFLEAYFRFLSLFNHDMVWLDSVISRIP